MKFEKIYYATWILHSPQATINRKIMGIKFNIYYKLITKLHRFNIQ